jgi:hypothetical protein
VEHSAGHFLVDEIDADVNQNEGTPTPDKGCVQAETSYFVVQGDAP